MFRRIKSRHNPISCSHLIREAQDARTIGIVLGEPNREDTVSPDDHSLKLYMNQIYSGSEKSGELAVFTNRQPVLTLLSPPRLGHGTKYLVSIQKLFVGSLIRNPSGFEQIDSIGMFNGPQTMGDDNDRFRME